MTQESSTINELVTRFEAFAVSERNLYSGEDNNRVGLALAQVGRYLRFVAITEDRYLQVSREVAKKFWESIEATKGQSGTRTLTKKEIAELEEDGRRSLSLQYEIESFFLFSKILLDKCAQFVEDYFGDGRSLSLKSHRKWCKVLNEYVKAKELHVPDEMPDLMEALLVEVGEYRDKGITHQRNPRTMHGTSIYRDGEARITTTTLYPKTSDRSFTSPVVATVTELLEKYIACLLQLIEQNRERSRYLLK